MPTNIPIATLEALSRLARRIAPRSVKEALQGLDALGVRAEPIREDRAIVGYTLHLPPGAPMRVLVIRKPDNYRRFSPEGLWFGYYQHTPKERATLVWLRDAARAALGAADPAVARAQAREQQGLPPTPRSKDPAVRTCGACFRDIKATAADRDGRDTTGKRDAGHRLIVDHGYSIYPGWRSDACWGVGRLPLEESPEALRLALEAHEARSQEAVVLIRRAQAALQGKPSAVAAIGALRIEPDERATRGSARRGSQEHQVVEVAYPDPRWLTTVRQMEENYHASAHALWSGGFLSIPWFRAALREWAPQAPAVVPAKGAPLVPLAPGDFAGRPPEATR